MAVEGRQWCFGQTNLSPWQSTSCPAPPSFWICGKPCRDPVCGPCPPPQGLHKSCWGEGTDSSARKSKLKVAVSAWVLSARGPPCPQCVAPAPGLWGWRQGRCWAPRGRRVASVGSRARPQTSAPPRGNRSSSEQKTEMAWPQMLRATGQETGVWDRAAGTACFSSGQAAWEDPHQQPRPRAPCTMRCAGGHTYLRSLDSREAQSKQRQHGGHVHLLTPRATATAGHGGKQAHSSCPAPAPAKSGSSTPREVLACPGQPSPSLPALGAALRRLLSAVPPWSRVPQKR